MNSEDNNRKVLCDIAHSVFEVVNRLLSRDQLLARELRSTETGSRQIYREECITVEMAATLREHFPDHVEITLFTPPEETRTGADWYWRFEKGDFAIHARVQAKRVQRTAFGESDDQGHIVVDSPQLEHLLQATRTAAQHIDGLQAWLATYARFNATPPCGCNNLQSCERHHHAEECADQQPSLWIANAQEIANSGIRQASVEQIVQNSVRLDCVLPCIDTSGASMPSPSNKGFVLQSGLQSYKECVAIIDNDSELRSEFRGALRIYQ